MDKNVRPKYVKKKVEIDFGAFCSLMPKSSIIADLRYAFNERHLYEEQVNEYNKATAREINKTKTITKTKKKKTGLSADSEEEQGPQLPPKYQFSFNIKQEPPKKPVTKNPSNKKLVS